jgi:hypothetical protein
VRRLGKDEIPLAFPLVREAGRCVSLESWRGYAADYLAGSAEGAWPSGIIVAEQASRCIVGLFSFVVRPCLRLGRVFSAGDLTIMAPFGLDEIAGHLLRSIDDLARRYRTRETEIVFAKSAARCAALLNKQGYSLDDRRQIVWRRCADDATAITRS